MIYIMFQTSWCLNKFVSYIQRHLNRRFHADLVFLFKLWNNFIDCPEILYLLNFHDPPVNIRTNCLFTIEFYRNVGMNGNSAYRDVQNNVVL